MNEQSHTPPLIVPRAEHAISRSNIPPHVLKVLYRLKEAGYEAYLVGGGVRDMLLGREPNDFDVATNARPEEVKALFRQCRLVGRRFLLAHVGFGRDVVEVATFRAKPTGDEDEDRVVEEDGRVLRDNVYGSMEDDAWRRDFTVNALYYNIRDFSVVDYTGGLEDLKAGMMRLIGAPDVRYREDPVRMLRAVRLAVKLGFRLDPETEQAIPQLSHLLAAIPPARLFEEVLKLFLGGCAVQTFEALRHYGLFRHLFPLTETALGSEQQGFPRMFVIQALTNTDERIQQDKPVTPAFLFAALLWEAMRRRSEQYQTEGTFELDALELAAHEVVQEQVKSVAFPKRFSMPMREIWAMQPRLARLRGRAPLRLLAHPRFRAAYDFLLLRAQAGEPIQELCDWWTRFQEVGETEREAMLRSGIGVGVAASAAGGAGNNSSGEASGAKKRKRRRRNRGKPRDSARSGPSATE